MVKVFTTSRYSVPTKALKAFAQAFLERRNAGEVLVNLIFVGKRKMREVASTYKHEDVALPVLAFPFHESQSSDSDQPLLGEVYLCYPQIVLLAAEKDKTVQAMLEQLIEHGVGNILQ